MVPLEDCGNGALCLDGKHQAFCRGAAADMQQHVLRGPIAPVRRERP